MIIPITDKQNKFSEDVLKTLLENGIRAELDSRSEKMQKKIRDAQNEKIPYMLVVGEKEVGNNKVAVRSRTKGDLGQIFCLVPVLQHTDQVVHDPALVAKHQLLEEIPLSGQHPADDFLVGQHFRMAAGFRLHLVYTGAARKGFGSFFGPFSLH